MDKFAIIIVFYVIVSIIRLLSSAAKNQSPGKKPAQIRLKPEDLQRIAQQRQLKVKPLDLTPKAVTPPPLPDLPEPFFDAPPDEEALAVDEELPEALEVREGGMMLDAGDADAQPAFVSNASLHKQALQGMIWSEILRPPLSLRR